MRRKEATPGHAQIKSHKKEGGNLLDWLRYEANEKEGGNPWTGSGKKPMRRKEATPGHAQVKSHKKEGGNLLDWLRYEANEKEGDNPLDWLR
jgi:hypothetical protein